MASTPCMKRRCRHTERRSGKQEARNVESSAVHAAHGHETMAPITQGAPRRVTHSCTAAPQISLCARPFRHGSRSQTTRRSARRRPSARRAVGELRCSVDHARVATRCKCSCRWYVPTNKTTPFIFHKGGASASASITTQIQTRDGEYTQHLTRHLGGASASASITTLDGYAESLFR